MDWFEILLSIFMVLIVVAFIACIFVPMFVVAFNYMWAWALSGGNV